VSRTPGAAARTDRLGGNADSNRGGRRLFALLSDIEFLVGDFNASEEAARESLRFAESGDDIRPLGFLGLAAIAAGRGEPEEVIRLAYDALAQVDDVDEDRRLPFHVDVASVLSDAGVTQEARTTYMQVSDEARRHGDSLFVALAEGNACWTDLLEQRYEAAEVGFGSPLSPRS
jgi:hypothetical protein